jgi:hypothetical protein
MPQKGNSLDGSIQWGHRLMSIAVGRITRKSPTGHELAAEKEIEQIRERSEDRWKTIGLMAR